ncbi:MAG: NACHT domain-containing protein, partial [bacterium]|nr:NACHT domain-containing protein [bacterium]
MEALKQSGISNRIVLMHHPPVNWLNEIDFNRYCDEIYKHCGLILCGHTHSDRALVFQSPAHSCISLGANASYTLDKDGFIGFQFIEVTFDGGRTAVKVWPYQMDSRGMVRFVEDYHRYEGQEGPFFELSTVAPPSKTKGKGKSPKLLEIPLGYKEWVEAFHSTMDIDLLARKGEVITVSLPEVYIPIETANPEYYKKQSEKQLTEKDFKGLGKEDGIEETEKIELPQSIDVEELVGNQNLVLLRGGAGMGKTTLIKHLAYTIVHNTCQPSLKGYLPVMIFLKDLWMIYNETLEKNKKKKIVFEELLYLYLEKVKCKLTMEVVSDFLAGDRVLFLMDGLDEVPGNLRSDLVEMMAQFQFAHKENRFLLTGRSHGIDGKVVAR